VGENSGARGTEAVKLSVKLLSGLALIALIAVAGVGLSRSASANADGKIYITNVASGLTNEASPPSSGGLATDSPRSTTSTVYGTYVDDAARDIVANSDYFVVTVIDSDLNTTEIVTDDNDGDFYDYDLAAAGDILDVSGAADGANSVGDQFRIVLHDTAKPIVGSASDIKIIYDDSTTEIPGLVVSEIFSSSPPIITVNVTIAQVHTDGARVQYPTSAVNETVAVLKSVVDGSGPEVTLTETGRDTGRFEGYIRVQKRTNVFTAGADGDGTTIGTAATVAAIGGPVTVTYTDEDTAGTAEDVARTVSATLDTTAPVATITGPTSGSETQNRLPTFSGNVTDNQSGIDVSTFGLYIDQTDDDDNTGTQIISNLGVPAKASADAGAPSSAVDGASTMAFSHIPGQAIPTDVTSNPDHLVDFQVRVADIAGNYGYSDSDASDDAAGVLGNKPHTVRIDQVIPQMSSAVTGTAYDVENSEEKLKVRDSIKVVFDGNVKASSISPSDFKVTFSGSGGVFVPASIIVNGKNVYLDLDSTIPSDNVPTVALQGTVQDLAGNSTDAGSTAAADGLPPVLTVTRSGGSGTGTGSEGPDSLTKADMVITVSSDEDLNGSPTITVDIPGGAEIISTLGIPQGGNVWKLTVSGGANGNRAITVVADDDSPANNRQTFGNDTDTVFVLDSSAAEVGVSPDSTTQANPFITVDYSTDASTLSVTSATLDGVDVTSHVVASVNKKKFFFQPTTALTNGSHTFEIKVVDAAGNTDTATHEFTKSSRTDFVIVLFAGWNAVSVPSNPLDDSIDAVFSNAGVKQVVAYDASTPSQPWRIASKVDGSFSSQTNPGLTSVNTGHGYWVETSDFENQKVALEGPTGPGDARPGLTTIPTGNGWNFVGVVDQSRIQTQGGDEGDPLVRPNGDAGGVTVNSYLSTVNHGRVYSFDTVSSEFRIQDAAVDGDVLKIGDGLWVYISPQQNGKLPHIVP